MSLLANQETCIRCEHVSQIYVILSCDLSVLPASPDLGPNSMLLQAYVLTPAIYYDRANTSQIPASSPPRSFLTPVLNDCVNVTFSSPRLDSAATFS